MEQHTAWQSVLQRNRDDNFRDKRYDLCRLWRALAYRDAQDEPEAITRAQAFKNVLGHLVIEIDEGVLVGHCRGFTSDVLPDGITDADYQTLMEEHESRGQRDFWAGFDHTLADYRTLLSIGLGGYRERVQLSMSQHQQQEEQVFLQAIDLTLEAFSDFIMCLAETAPTPNAKVLFAITSAPPTTFHEAIQLVWLTHLVFKSEGRAHMALGRIDQYLWPFYERDIANATLSRDDARSLLCHLWARLDEIAEVQNICIGGLTPESTDGTNELSYLCLQATRLVGSPHANLSARFHDGTPDAFHRACFEVIRTGIGFPAIFNDHVLQAGLMEIGIPVEVARDACMVGCIETMIAGRQPAWSDSRFNTPLVLLTALQALAEVPEPTYEKLITLLHLSLREAITSHVDMVNTHIARFPANRYPDPFLSALTHNCIARALDVNAGGAEFERFHGIAIMGLATIADSLATLKILVFEQQRIPLMDLMKALADDFEDAEQLRQLLLNRAPKYGNGDEIVDAIAAQVVQWTSEECLRHTNHGSGRFVSAMAANVQNISAGREVGATPDGRHAGTPLSDAASPYYGRDEHGPTAFLQSVAVPDYHNVLTGSVINMRFDPAHFEDDVGAERFLAFTRYFVDQRIPELQFNFTSDATLLAAQRNPEQYRNLVVRVSGFSARFVDLASDVQNDIMRRRMLH